VYVPGVNPIPAIVCPPYVELPLMTVFETYPEGTYNKRPLPPGRIPNVEPVFDVTPAPPLPKVNTNVNYPPTTTFIESAFAPEPQV
jgi:hypothetical protein